MDGQNVDDFVFFGAPIPSFDDYEWFEEMFLLLQQLHNMVVESERTERIPQRTSALHGNDFIFEILTGHLGRAMSCSG